jgi:hypothetical protein
MLGVQSDVPLSACEQERLWRLRAKRAWIREQLAAARGFPAAASGSYAEPWGEALGAPSHARLRNPLP